MGRRAGSFTVAMELCENLQRVKRTLTRTDFERKFPHPWLIRELEESERPALFRTMVTMPRRTAEAAPVPAGPPLRADGLARTMASDPGRFGIYPVVKGGSNPWSDRVLVGRAANNDIVLKNDRISKLHAWFQLGSRGIWRVFDARSANGTRVDGVVVPPGEAGVEIRPGQILTFGTVAAELVDSGTLYDSI